MILVWEERDWRTRKSKSGSHVYRILLYKTSAARLDEIRVGYIIF